jgi:Cys-tRNA synthase (O-phospho-L-seryl-tRNA:Cys-tRNA synthase)
VSPRPAKFRQIDVTRALKAAKAAGVSISRCEIDAEGKIVIVSDVAHMATTVAPGRTAYERWKAEQNEPK